MNLNSNIQKINFRKLKLTDFKNLKNYFIIHLKKISYKFLSGDILMTDILSVMVCLNLLI